jgi:hypothetical protein
MDTNKHYSSKVNKKQSWCLVDCLSFSSHRPTLNNWWRSLNVFIDGRENPDTLYIYIYIYDTFSGILRSVWADSNRCSTKVRGIEVAINVNVVSKLQKHWIKWRYAWLTILCVYFLKFSCLHHKLTKLQIWHPKWMELCGPPYRKSWIRHWVGVFPIHR